MNIVIQNYDSHCKSKGMARAKTMATAAKRSDDHAIFLFVSIVAILLSINETKAQPMETEPSEATVITGVNTAGRLRQDHLRQLETAPEGVRLGGTVGPGRGTVGPGRVRNAGTANVKGKLISSEGWAATHRKAMREVLDLLHARQNDKMKDLIGFKLCARTFDESSESARKKGQDLECVISMIASGNCGYYDGHPDTAIIMYKTALDWLDKVDTTQKGSLASIINENLKWSEKLKQNMQRQILKSDSVQAEKHFLIDRFSQLGAPDKGIAWVLDAGLDLEFTEPFQLAAE